MANLAAKLTIENVFKGASPSGGIGSGGSWGGCFACFKRRQDKNHLSDKFARSCVFVGPAPLRIVPYADLKLEERKRKGIKTRDEQTLEFRMVRQRRFRYRISKARINADEKLTGCFLHFSVGGITREVATECVSHRRTSALYFFKSSS